jgi:hypothetical protein
MAARFERIALTQFLVAGCAAVFSACVLIERAQAQPGYVPPSPPPPPPVFNPSSPYTVPQPSYTPLTPSTPSTTPSIPSTVTPSIPSTVPSSEVTSPANEEPPSRAARPEREASAEQSSVHRHRGRFARLGSNYCGYSPCVRIVVAEPPPVYRASVLWWPGFYDHADGQFARGRPRYEGYGRRSGYHGD